VNELFKAELGRFFKAGLLYGVLHLLLLAFMTRLVDLLQQPLLVYRVAALVFAFTGLLLAAYQMSQHRKPGAWVYLLHRPLHPARIAMALAGAAAVLLFVAIALPLLLDIGGVALFSARIVDTRHWLLPLCAWAIAFGVYLCGACAMLAPRRGMALLLCLPLLSLAAPASGGGALAVQLLVVLLAAGLLLTLFHPDLTSLPRAAAARVAIVLVMQVGLSFALYWVLTLGVEFGLMALGRHPLNGIPPAGGYAEAERADSAALLRAGLGNDARFALLREQAGVAEQAAWGPGAADYPHYGQLTSPMPLEFDDATRHLRWSFSHDRGLFHGVDLATRKDAGWLGRRGIVQGAAAAADRFEQPPLVFDERYLVTPHRLYQFNAIDQSVHLRIALPEDEYFTAAPRKLGTRVLVLGSRRLHVYNGSEFLAGTSQVKDLHTLPLDGAIDNIGRIDAAELLDGYLVSLLHGRQSYHQDVPAWQSVFRLHEDGRVEALARREIGRDYPLLFRHLGWVVTPLWYALQYRLGWIVSGDAEGLPRAAWIAIAALAVACMLITAWQARRAGLRPRERLLWILANGVTGLPGLLSFLLLYPPAVQPRKRGMTVLHTTA